MGVYKKNNRWYIDYYLPNGRRKREVVGHVDKINKSIADKALKSRLGEIVQGKFNLESVKKPMRMNELFNKFLEWARTNHKDPNKTKSLVKPLRVFFGERFVSDLNLWIIDKYKAQRKSEQKKPETINRELGILRRILNLAVEWKLIIDSPIKGLTLLKGSRYIARTLSIEEFERLYSFANVRLKPVLLCAYLTGMRKSEIRKLKWEDVNLKDGYLIIKESKNLESRMIPLHSHFNSTLIELKRKSKSQYVFATSEGKTYKSDTPWTKAFRIALRTSGLGHLRFHDLRHTFVSNLIVREKEDFKTVMSLSGHKDMRMLKRYTHTDQLSKKNAIDKLGGSLKLDSNGDYLDTKDTTSKPTFHALSIVTLRK